MIYEIFFWNNTSRRLTLVVKYFLSYKKSHFHFWWCFSWSLDTQTIGFLELYINLLTQVVTHSLTWLPRSHREFLFSHRWSHEYGTTKSQYHPLTFYLLLLFKPKPAQISPRKLTSCDSFDKTTWKATTLMNNIKGPGYVVWPS